MNNDLPGGEAVDRSSNNDQDTPELLEHPSYEALEKKLTEAEQKVSEYWDRIVRMQAEADNLQRRTERDVSNAHKYALERFINELLPIIDSLELGIHNASTDLAVSAHAVIEGVQLTHKLFLSVLTKFGVQQVNPIKEPFNPEYHQAISMQQDDSVPPGAVISVLQKGYTLNQRLVRPALVVVAKIND